MLAASQAFDAGEQGNSMFYVFQAGPARQQNEHVFESILSQSRPRRPSHQGEIKSRQLRIYSRMICTCYRFVILRTHTKFIYFVFSPTMIEGVYLQCIHSGMLLFILPFYIKNASFLGVRQHAVSFSLGTSVGPLGVHRVQPDERPVQQVFTSAIAPVPCYYRLQNPKRHYHFQQYVLGCVKGCGDPPLSTTGLTARKYAYSSQLSGLGCLHRVLVPAPVCFRRTESTASTFLELARERFEARNGRPATFEENAFAFDGLQVGRVSSVEGSFGVGRLS